VSEREGSDVEDDQSNFLPKRKIFQQQTKTPKNMREKKSLTALEIFILKLLFTHSEMLMLKYTECIRTKKF
jgi:hypothetical protein